MPLPLPRHNHPDGLLEGAKPAAPATLDPQYSNKAVYGDAYSSAYTLIKALHLPTAKLRRHRPHSDIYRVCARISAVGDFMYST